MQLQTQIQMLAAMQNNSPQSPHQTSAEHQLIRLQAITSYEAESSLLDAEYKHQCKRAKLLHDSIHQK
jgi:hypothetical protein